MEPHQTIHFLQGMSECVNVIKGVVSLLDSYKPVYIQSSDHTRPTMASKYHHGYQITVSFTYNKDC